MNLEKHRAWAKEFAKVKLVSRKLAELVAFLKLVV